MSFFEWLVCVLTTVNTLCNFAVMHMISHSLETDEPIPRLLKDMSEQIKGIHSSLRTEYCHIEETIPELLKDISEQIKDLHPK